MTYINAIKYINAQKTSPSPERMRLLCRYLGDPQGRPMRFVHIVGGRGKTSSAIMLSNVLTEANFKVGSFVSPCIFELRERICIGNVPLSHNDFAEYVRRVSVAAAKMKADIELACSENTEADGSAEYAVTHKITKNLLEGKIAPDPSAEEVVCAAALIAFKDKGCDISILECGDSRADPTGVIEPPLVSFICGASLDQEQLRTACGTIRRGTREVVCSAVGKEAYSTISSTCAKTGSRMTVPAHGELSIRESGLGGRVFDYRGKNYSVPFCAEYHISNALAAIETVYALRRTGIPLHSADVARGIAKARIPLRFEFLSVAPAIIIDSAESIADIAVLCESLSSIKGMIGDRITVLVSEDFDSKACNGAFEKLGFEKKETVKLGSRMIFKKLSAIIPTLTDRDVLLVLGSPEFTGNIKKELERALAYR